MADQYEKGLIRTDRGLFVDKGNYAVDAKHPDFAGGAKGDGSTNDRAAIAAADAHAVTLGACLMLGPGDYYVATNLTISSLVDLLPGASFTGPGTVTYTPRFSQGGANVKTYGAVGDGVTDDTAAIQAAVDSGAADIFFPAGTYFLAEGSSITLVNDQKLCGEGRQRTFISSKNAYAFKTPASGNLDRVHICDIAFTLRSGSTSGGAIKAVSDSYHSQWLLERLYGDGQTGCADAVFQVSGWIGSHFSDVQAQTCQIGISTVSGFANNAVTFFRCRVSTATVAGFYLYGGGANQIIYSIIENCTGYGIWNDGCTNAIIYGNWFENQGNADVYVTDGAGHTLIEANMFHYHQSGTGAHIKLVGPASPAALYGVKIYDNNFVNAAGAGYDISINADCAGTRIKGNKWSNPASAASMYSDAGTGTQFWDNTSNDNVVGPNRVGGYWETANTPYYGQERPGPFWGRRRTSQTTELLLLEDENGNDFLSVDYLGRLLTRASATGSAGLRIPHGTAPSSPVDGDIWTTAAGGLFVRINGVTKSVDLT